MKHIIDAFTKTIPATEDAPEREVRVFITDIVLDYKDKAVLKHLTNSDIDIQRLKDIADAYRLAEKLDAKGKLVTSQENVHIRYQKWSMSKNKKQENDKDYGQCEEPSIGPEHVYKPSIVELVIRNIVGWCRERSFQSFLPFEMLDTCVARAIYPDCKELDEQQLAVVNFVKKEFAERYLIISPFNDKGYNLGSELMTIMYPNGVKYRTQKYTKGKKNVHYYIIKGNTITDTRTGETKVIPNGTFRTRNEYRLKIDQTMYYSKAA